MLPSLSAPGCLLLPSPSIFLSLCFSSLFFTISVLFFSLSGDFCRLSPCFSSLALLSSGAGVLLPLFVNGESSCYPACTSPYWLHARHLPRFSECEGHPAGCSHLMWSSALRNHWAPARDAVSSFTGNLGLIQKKLIYEDTVPPNFGARAFLPPSSRNAQLLEIMDGHQGEAGRMRGDTIATARVPHSLIQICTWKGVQG